MRIVVLGGAGMLGHKMYQALREAVPDTWCTVRTSRQAAKRGRIPLLCTSGVLYSVDVTQFQALSGLLRALQPDVTLNCVGAIKQRREAGSATVSITVNALLPHQLVAVVGEWGGRLIHFSTDCVFSGARGSYVEADHADATDLYGRSKYLGEVTGSSNALTLRTSIIGRELSHHQSLLDWFLQQKGGAVKGYTEAWWSGVTTNYLAQLVARIVLEHPSLTGLYHVSSGRISKHELLCKLNDAYGRDLTIRPDATERCDRSLIGERLTRDLGTTIPSLDAQIEQLVRDPTPYEEWTR